MSFATCGSDRARTRNLGRQPRPYWYAMAPVKWMWFTAVARWCLGGVYQRRPRVGGLWVPPPPPGQAGDLGRRGGSGRNAVCRLLTQPTGPLGTTPSPGGRGECPGTLPLRQGMGQRYPNLLLELLCDKNKRDLWGTRSAGEKNVKSEINGENFSRNPIFIAA